MEISNQLYIMRDPLYRRGLNDLIEYTNSIRPTVDMTMIEIGSYAGESTEIFSKYFKSVIAIDPFINNYDQNDLTCNYLELTKVYDIFAEVVDRCKNISHIRKTSDEAVYDLTGIKVDFIYIDGLHTYKQIKKDIINYLPLLNKKGFIAGHDYHPVWQGIVDGVHETLGVPDKTFCDTSWIKKIN